MEKAYARCPRRLPGTEGLALGPALQAEKATLSRVSEAERRAEAEQNICAKLHRIVKKVIPRFSLDRGFEFRNVVRLGERQCFLQAVLIAGLLQRMGIDAGVVMVYRNPHGAASNNGHAVTLVKLAGGHDLLVDASEPEPFPHHRGLFVRKGAYRYVEPAYDTGTDRIVSYRSTAGGERIDPARLRMLDYGFIRSQFWYYRGERAEGALLSAHRTKTGLGAAARALRRSVSLCPENSLSTYMLGRVYLANGKSEKARGLFAQAYRLYSRFGWVPAGPKQYLGLAGSHGSGRAGA
jgi:hypothetical protein